MCIMNEHENGSPTLTDKNFRALEWCAFSLANDERRKTLQALSEYPQGCTSAGVAQVLGLPTNPTANYLQQLASLKVCRRTKGVNDNADRWIMDEPNIREIILRLSGTEQHDEVLQTLGDEFVAGDLPFN